MSELKKKKTGSVCAASGCKNKQYNCSDSFFHFPKDPERARVWLEVCKREDLIVKIETLHKTHRLCSSHFEPDTIIESFQRKLLRKNAVPTIFPTSIEFIIDTAPSTSRSLSMNDDETDTVCSMSRNSFVSTARLTLREQKLWKLLKNLQKENDVLEERIKKLEEENSELKMKFQNGHNSVTFDQLKELIFKFCPCIETAEFINVQLTQSQHALKDPESKPCDLDVKLKDSFEYHTVCEPSDSESKPCDMDIKLEDLSEYNGSDGKEDLSEYNTGDGSDVVDPESKPCNFDTNLEDLSEHNTVYRSNYPDSKPCDMDIKLEDLSDYKRVNEVTDYTEDNAGFHVDIKNETCIREDSYSDLHTTCNIEIKEEPLLEDDM